MRLLLVSRCVLRVVGDADRVDPLCVAVCVRA